MKAERIIRLAEQTRRYETEREKVLPFYESSVEEERRRRGRRHAARAAGERGGQGRAPIEEWNYLDQFFKRYNKVLLDVMGIERERERLARQNADVRSILKQYLDGISVNEDVINNPNPLLVVNHKTNVVMPTGYQRPPPATIVEGAHTVMSVNGQLAQGRQGASI